jgi:hypothetical protein
MRLYARLSRARRKRTLTIAASCPAARRADISRHCYCSQITGNQEVINSPVGLVPRNALVTRIRSAQIQPDKDGNRSILENGEIRSTYPSRAIRFSILWKAAIGDRQANADDLTLDRIMAIFTTDLRRRSVEFQVPSDPLADTTWILLLQRIYAD